MATATLLICCPFAAFISATSVADIPAQAVAATAQTVSDSFGVAPGARAWISQHLLTYAATNVVPLLIEQVDKLHLPDIKGEKDGFEYKISNFKISGVGLSPTFEFVNGTGIRLAVDKIVANIRCDWSYKLHSWPHVPDGAGYVIIPVHDGTHADGTLHPGTKEGKPTLTLSGTSVKLDLGKIQVHGSMLSWLYDLLIDAVQGSITKAISSALTTALTNFVNDDLAQILAALTPVLPIPFPAPYNVAAIDLSVLSFATTATHVAAGVRGEVIPTDASKPAYPVAPLPLPDTPPSSFSTYMIALSLTQYFLNSGLYVFWKQGLLTYTVTPDEVPPSFPIQLRTSSFRGIAPELVTKYGMDANMTLTASAVGEPKVTFGGKGAEAISATMPSELAFAVLLPNGSSAPAFSIGAPVNVSVHVWVSRFDNGTSVVQGNISLLSVTPLSVLHSDCGTVHVALLSGVIRFLLSGIIVPEANKIIAGGVPIPSAAGLSVNRTAILVEGGALQVLVDIAYDPASATKRALAPSRSVQ